MSAPAARQLGLELHPVGAHAVGDRVRVKHSAKPLSPGGFRLSIDAGDEGTVIEVRPLCSRRSDSASWLPVVVQLDGDKPGLGQYAFDHEDLESLASHPFPALVAAPAAGKD